MNKVLMFTLGAAVGSLITWKLLEKKYKDIDSMLKTNTLHILKLAVLNDNLPLTDRINAGEQYIKLGGNGFIKKKYPAKHP